MKKFDILDIYRLNRSVFSTQDIALIWKETDPDTIKARINYYVKKKKLFPLRKGFYAKDSEYSRFELASRIYTPSYISLETVLQKEGMIFQFYESIFVVSYLFREITCGDQKYAYRKIKNEVLTNAMGLKEEANCFMATKERAFLDTLYLYGDYHFDNLKPLDWELCARIAPIYNNKSMVKRFNSYYKAFQHD
jgi:hypothetical protein